MRQNNLTEELRLDSGVLRAGHDPTLHGTLKKRQGDEGELDLSALGPWPIDVPDVLRFLAIQGTAIAFIAFASFMAYQAMYGAAPISAAVIATALGAYMALNIGANDVANNMGPAVGSGAISLKHALFIAVIFEVVGAVLAGKTVISTVSTRIVDTSVVSDPNSILLVMLSSLAAAALWVNAATLIKAPVSTTHSIVGGVAGAALAAAGFFAVDWATITAISLSWLISPVLGGAVAAAVFWILQVLVVWKTNKIEAARRWVPIFFAITSGVFTAYIYAIASRNYGVANPILGALVSVCVLVTSWAVMRVHVTRLSKRIPNSLSGVCELFKVPLILCAALLSFAHGANDVANAVGPITAILHVAEYNDLDGQIGVPVWATIIGAAGIALGLVLFGHRLIKVVGREITRLNPLRASCIALSAASTVSLASWFGMPVSATHIAIGAIFGIGFMRESLSASKRRRARLRQISWKRSALEDGSDEPAPLYRSVRRRKLIRRTHVLTIMISWLVTVPTTGAISAIIYTVINVFSM